MKQFIAIVIFSIVLQLSTQLVMPEQQMYSESNTFVEETVQVNQLASQGFEYLPDEFTFITDDLSTVEDTIIKYHVEIAGGTGTEEIQVYSSNDKIAKIINGTPDFKNGDTAKIQITGYGRAVITAKIKNSPRLINSFPIYVSNASFVLPDSIHNISIASKHSKNFLDPFAEGSDQYKSSYEFYAISKQKASITAEHYWEVNPPNVARILESKTTDTARIYFPKGGYYKISIRQKNNDALLDTLSFHVKMDEALSADTTTGYISSIIDPRDGSKYKVSYFETSGGDNVLMFRENLKYLPYVQAIRGYKEYNYPLIMAESNTDYTAVDSVYQKYVKKGKTVMYNLYAAFGLKGQFNTAPSIASLIKNKGIICPSDWEIPNRTELENIIGSSSIDQSILDSLSWNTSTPTIDITNLAASAANTINSLTINNTEAQELSINLSTRGISYATFQEKKLYTIRCWKKLD